MEVEGTGGGGSEVVTNDVVVVEGGAAVVTSVATVVAGEEKVVVGTEKVIAGSEELVATGTGGTANVWGVSIALQKVRKEGNMTQLTPVKKRSVQDSDRNGKREFCKEGGKENGGKEEAAGRVCNGG
ncbi:hypothetical protein C2845_PMPSC039938 [Panicum miliaceum]|uniref:Uncharacterized protein n=1 Tax=Panicum miliaceum TaxID=4540 RepID=A0A3L6P9L8_PANMI|nr:hypothetical protein C2845_PMPSC039938 [Panicum miliaceum]